MWPFAPKDSLPTFVVETTIGAGTCVRGDLAGPGGFRVDGSVEGAIDADGPVVVGQGGSVEGGIRGRDVVVLGRVRGDVHASGHLEIGPKGQICGDITVHSMRMHKGGVFRGTSSMPGDGQATLPLLASNTALQHAGNRGRTLPPPTGAVPPPPSLAELASILPARSPTPEGDGAVSQERLVSSETPDRATGS